MYCPFLVSDPQSGLTYRLTDVRLAELSLAPIAPVWSPGRAIADAPDPVCADSLIKGPLDAIASTVARRGAAKAKHAAGCLDRRKGLTTAYS